MIDSIPLCPAELAFTDAQGSRQIQLVLNDDEVLSG